MADIDAVLKDVPGSEGFPAINFTYGYWQLHTGSDSQPLHAFMTPDGAMQPTMTTQGGCNSAANFQACVEPFFSDLRDNLLAWLDDVALHNQTENGLLRVLSRFLDTCAEYRLVVSLPKSTFFGNEMKWCGRIIDSTGVTMDPANYEGAKNAVEPSNAAKLCQYVHCAAWMNNAIPRFAERAAPLYALLEATYNKVVKRTKKAIARLSLSSLGWNDEHSKAFHRLQDELQEVVKTAHRNPDIYLHVHSKASDTFWAFAVTQSDATEFLKPTNEQRHEPLAFLSSPFSGAQEHLSTYEKEALAVVQKFIRLNYLFGCSGELNTTADIIKRWMRVYRNSVPTPRYVARLDMVTGSSMIPTFPENLSQWPSRESTREVQCARTNRNEDLQADEDGLLRTNEKLWVPEEADELKLKLLTAA